MFLVYQWGRFNYSGAPITPGSHPLPHVVTAKHYGLITGITLDLSSPAQAGAGKGRLEEWPVPVFGYRLNARSRTPLATRIIPSHSRTEGRSPRKANANTATRTMLNLSTGATFDASPI